MSKNAAALQVKYLNCQLSMDTEKSYVVFIAESVTNQVLQCLYKKKVKKKKKKKKKKLKKKKKKKKKIKNKQTNRFCNNFC